MGGGRSRPLVPLLVLTAVAAMAACTAPPAPGPSDVLRDDAITVASFNFSESVLLGELYAGALEAAGFRVDRQLDLGTREIVEPALQRGLVEVLSEYAGSALEFVAGEDSATADVGRTHLALVSAMAARGVIALEAAPAQDRNALAVTAATAQRLRLARTSDLVPSAERLSIGGPPECPQRPLCLPGLFGAYGLSFDRFVPLDAGGPLTTSALAEGYIDVAVMFTTAPASLDRDVVLLRDDRELQPAENVTPLVRREVLQRFGPRVADVLNAVSAQLTTAELRRMNAEVDAGRPPVSVARAWLSEHASSVGAR
ncbi:MAG TPA: ABC transporter substrate-binding protein [Actinomycetota bacterium]|nr:ABC transporter substrate-binding protein [Actinomycetota bacterium]